MLFHKRISKAATSDPDDLSLVKRYQEKEDLQVLGLLYQRYTGLVFGVCMKYLKSEEDSKDAVMQIFEQLVNGLKKHEVTNFKSWLHVVTKNYCLMRLRSQKNKFFQDIDNISLEKDVEFTYELHHDSENELEFKLEEMRKALDQLSVEQKKCVELFYLEQKSYREIEDITGFELKKVKSYIQNGRRNLKLLMEKS